MKDIETTEMRTTQNGWITFAGIMMVIVGFFHIIEGIVALAKPTYYVATQTHTLAFSYTGWGWTHIIFGIILAASAGSLFAGRMWGRSIAIIAATISAVVNFSFIWAYPIWSITLLVVDLMIIYSVAMYGGLGRDNN